MTDNAVLDVQKQEVGSNLVELFEILITPDDESNGDAFYIFNGLDADNNNVYFPNIDEQSMNEYIAVPVEIDGIEITAGGANNRPLLRIANIPVLARNIVNNEDGQEDEITLAKYLEARSLLYAKDFLGATVRYRTTLEKYLYTSSDSVETPTEFPMHTYIIDRIAGENNVLVEFELINPVDLEAVVLPSRKMASKYCMWEYQGLAKGRGGCSWPLNSNGRFFDIKDNVITKDITSITEWNSSSTYSAGNKVKVTSVSPSGVAIYEAIASVPANINPTHKTVYWKRIDVCGKRLNSCKYRFQGNNSDTDLDNSVGLPFGAFLGSRKGR